MPTRRPVKGLKKPKRREFHVVWVKRTGRWSVTLVGAAPSWPWRPGDCVSQRELAILAYRLGRRSWLSERVPAEVFIHHKGTDRIRERRSYGLDPRRSRG